MIVDCQAHWYPAGFFEALSSRRGYPRARRDAGRLFYDFGPGASLELTERHTNLELVLATLAGAGIDVAIASPASIGVDGLPGEEAEELSLLLNEAQAAGERAHAGRFFGLATLPLVDTDASLRVLDDAVGRLSLRGVYMHSNVDGEALDAPRLRPVFARLEQAGLPVFLHPTKTILSDRLGRFGLEYVVGFPFDTTIAALSLLFGGVLDEFPALRIVHPHLGATVPFLAGRIDFEYRQPWAQSRALDRAPSEYLRSFWTDTVSDNPGALRLALEFYGEGKLLFGSDYPWWPPADGVALVERTLDPREAAAVLGGNAVELLAIRGATGPNGT
jgi:aminocarboxymuconate-semialdehyde decarboxylase